MTTAPASSTAHSGLPGYARRALRSFVFGALVAVCLSLVLQQNFADTLVYSLCIAPLAWFFIDAGRVAAARWTHRHAPAGSAQAQSRWPGWRWMALVVAAGAVLSATLGMALGNRITGLHAPGPFDGDARRWIALLLPTLIAAIGFTFFYYARATIEAQRARAEAAQRQAAETQLTLLQSQLEPHMLFNTLANLRVLIGSDPVRAQAMLDQLIAFLRATLSASRQPAHPLAAEFDRLRDYLALMQVRMGDRLRARLDLPEALAALMVPPLLLQPLVENAIKHGLEPKVEGGEVHVEALKEAGQLVLRVRDTGVGLGAASALPDAGFGLAQVRERLATLYGAAASLELAAAGDAAGGTLATVRLPLPRP